MSSRTDPWRKPTALARGLFLLAAAPALGLLRAAPPPVGAERGRCSGPASRLRATLRASTAEGVATELFTACAGPTVLIAWALHLGASPLEVAVVAALPQLATLAQLPGAWATALFGRRRVALVTIALSRQAVLPLALVPALGLAPETARGLVVGLAAVSAVLAVAGNNAWTAWMGELVPPRIRGRYFGGRTAALTAGSTAAGLAVGLALDGAGSRGAAGAALTLLTLAAGAFGAASVMLLARQHEPEGPPAPRPSLAEVLRPLRDPAARGVLVYQLAWNASVGVAASYFTWHMVKNMEAGFTLVAVHAALAAVGRVLAAPLWGRAIDRVGARPVLLVCSVGIGVLPLLWLLSGPGVIWPLLVDAPLGGICWGGHGLAAFSVPLAVAPRAGRSFYLAAFAMAGGLAWGLSAALSGAIMAALPLEVASLGRGPAHAVDVAFVTSSALRLSAAFLALRIAERGARPVGELGELAAGAARGALAVATARAR